MTRSAPRVSVTLPVYNNGRQVEQAIESVLGQTMSDLELVIVDDGSTDDTAERIERLDDPRIVFLRGPNRGGAHATNVAIRAARGRYVALFAGDDVCRPERLERELHHLETTGDRIVFSWVDFIGDDDRPLPGDHFASGWFNHPQRSRAEMLSRFFFDGNDLCTVSCMAERSLFLDAGLFLPNCAQIPDFAMWLSLIRHHRLAVIEEPLIDYRIHQDGRNVSSPLNFVRADFELGQVYRTVFDGMDDQLFRDAFGDRLRYRDFRPGPEWEMEKALLHLQHRLPAVRRLGVERLWHLLRDHDHLVVAEDRYRFGLPQLFDLANSMDVTGAVEHLEVRQWAIDLEREYKALSTGYEALEVEYRKLEEYTRHVLAVKEGLEVELRQVCGWDSAEPTQVEGSEPDSRKELG